MGEELVPCSSQLEQLFPNFFPGNPKHGRKHRNNVLLEENHIGVLMVLDDRVQQVQLGKLLIVGDLEFKKQNNKKTQIGLRSPLKDLFKP